MGEHDVKELDSESLRAFTRKLLGDLQALDLMLQHGAIETGVRRIGAEQELFLVDRDFAPAPLAMEMIEKVADEHYTTELARFNLEFNTDPLVFGGDCLSRMEGQLVDLLAKGRRAAHELDADLVMTGILQTLDISDLSLENMTPKPRYFALNEAMRRLRGSAYEFYIKGADELIIRHENVMVEACNTSFQAHFQVGPEEFASLYNLTQAVAGPVLAAACNSPLLFGRRLWRETRIALFQQSVDHRAAGLHLREQPSRVSFGRRWVDDSVLEIFKEDIARFKVLLSADIDEDSLDMLRRNEVPNLEGVAAPQRHDLSLDASLLRHLRRQAASANREPDPARRSEHRRRGRQRRLLVRTPVGALARLSGHSARDGVRHRQRELRRRRPPRPARPVRLAGAPSDSRRRAHSRGAVAGGQGRSQAEGHRSFGRRSLPRDPRGARAHQADGRAVAARQSGGAASITAIAASAWAPSPAQSSRTRRPACRCTSGRSRASSMPVGGRGTSGRSSSS